MLSAGNGERQLNSTRCKSRFKDDQPQTSIGGGQEEYFEPKEEENESKSHQHELYFIPIGGKEHDMGEERSITNDEESQETVMQVDKLCCEPFESDGQPVRQERKQATLNPVESPQDNDQYFEPIEGNTDRQSNTKDKEEFEHLYIEPTAPENIYQENNQLSRIFMDETERALNDVRIKIDGSFIAEHFV